MKRVLLAGASGRLGREAARELLNRGYWVRAVTRHPARLEGIGVHEIVNADLTQPGSLASVCTGMDVVLSCAGAAMDVGNFKDRLSFYAVDHLGNRNLLEAARKAGVHKFVYVSLAHAEELRETEYADAHERFVGELKTSGLHYSVVRPTGFFCFLEEILKFAKRGRGIIVGTGECRTNPIHEAEVGRACVDALEGTAGEIAVGGPEIMTRKQLTLLAFEVLGTKPNLMHLSPGLFRKLILPMRFFNRRVHALMAFGVAVTQVDVVAPAYGKERLRDYFEAAAKGMRD